MQGNQNAPVPVLPRSCSILAAALVLTARAAAVHDVISFNCVLLTWDLSLLHFPWSAFECGRHGGWGLSSSTMVICIGPCVAFDKRMVCRIHTMLGCCILPYAVDGCSG